MAVPRFGEIAEQLRRSTVLIHAGGCGSGSGVTVHPVRIPRCVLRVEFLRGDYTRNRRVSVQLANSLPARSSFAA